MCWMVICKKRQKLSSCWCICNNHLKVKGHMDATLHVKTYFGLHHYSHLCMDPAYPDIYDEQFPMMDWKGFHGSKCPKALVQTSRCMHVCGQQLGRDKHTRNSHSHFITYFNTFLIEWYSKTQAMIETGVSGTKIVDNNMGVDALRGLRNSKGWVLT